MENKLISLGSLVYLLGWNQGRHSLPLVSIQSVLGRQAWVSRPFQWASFSFLYLNTASPPSTRPSCSPPPLPPRSALFHFYMLTTLQVP